MNSFGRLFRVSLFGESHGPIVGILVDGCPAGIEIGAEDFAADLGRRKGGRPGTTSRVEPDEPRLMSGVHRGRTTGAPLLIYFENRDVRSEDYRESESKPRPGHADLAASRKYGGFQDGRGGGHFSGRLTAGIVAAGVVAKKIIRPIEIRGEIISCGGSADIEAAVSAAAAERDSVGGVVECLARDVPAGLGEPFFDSVESVLGHLVFSIPGIKGIEFGDGFRGAASRGSEFNDAILDASGRTRTNHAGGLNGGLTNGNDLLFRVAVRPTPTIGREQETIDLGTGRPSVIASGGRHDACIALRLPVILEAAAALVIADFMLISQVIPRIGEKPWTS
jgi:chorismate synthase